MRIKVQEILKVSLFALAITSFLFLSIFTYFAPSTVVAQTSATDSVLVTLNVTAGIAIDSPADVTMSRNLSMTNMTAVGTSTWTVTTNNITGYSLTIKATSSPAMQQNATTTIDDYHTGTPDAWTVAPGTAKFGFSAYGTDSTTVPTNPWGVAGASFCASTTNPHAPSTTLNYLGFTTSTSSPEIARRSATTTFAGTPTTVCFAVEQNGFYIPSGTYTATIIATAVTI